jgi:phosphoribosylformimino-5-aminoimidazole carboxamide ribotide isomerase
MEFRPCIDIHNGTVKQIVGSSLCDEGNTANENFVSARDAGYYADIYHEHGLKGGHVIILNSRDSGYYQASRQQAERALRAHPGEMQIGGGIMADNARDFIDAGASHVIVTSYVFRDGKIYGENLDKLCGSVGRDHIVLDLSCRKRGNAYYVVTDRWQKFTDTVLSEETLEMLSDRCDEFLVHAADVEGRTAGIEREVVRILGGYRGNAVTYAGGIRSCADIDIIGQDGRGRVNVTVGSALDLFGGKMTMEEIMETVSRY